MENSRNSLNSLRISLIFIEIIVVLKGSIDFPLRTCGILYNLLEHELQPATHQQAPGVRTTWVLTNSFKLQQCSVGLNDCQQHCTVIICCHNTKSIVDDIISFSADLEQCEMTKKYWSWMHWTTIFIGTEGGMKFQMPAQQLPYTTWTHLHGWTDRWTDEQREAGETDGPAEGMSQCTTTDLYSFKA